MNLLNKSYGLTPPEPSQTIKHYQSFENKRVTEEQKRIDLALFNIGKHSCHNQK